MAFTEFFCQNGGSNLNAGSTTNNTAAYTSIHGNYVQGTGVFTPTDGSTPASTVNVNDWASVYIDGAVVSSSVARISAVTAGVNGAITANSNVIGAKPINQTGTATIKVGGAWKGPNAASFFPFTLSSYSNNQDASGHPVRTNLKNDQTYSVTVSATLIGASAKSQVIQGYSSTVGDGGKATFDGGVGTDNIIAGVGLGTFVADMIFLTSNIGGAGNLVVVSNASTWFRCVFTGARVKGLQVNTPGCFIIECEAYACNKSNTAFTAAFHADNGGTFYRCIAHDNTGSNTSGFSAGNGPFTMYNCISETNGQYGVYLTGTTINGPYQIENCDIYNNTSDGINVVSSCVNSLLIENCNFIKNGGAGLKNNSTAIVGNVYTCGYGAGTQANTNADTLNNLAQSGTVTYGNNLTPWVDPANGDFRINLASANFVGHGTFTETAVSYAGTVGYPDIGAAQSKTGTGGTFSKEVSFGFA